MTFSDKIISFNRQLEFKGSLPDGISLMNPFKDQQINTITSAFYRKFYNDNKPRRLILGINPGRFGAGVTGIPFTDTKRLKEKCGIEISGLKTFELSSVFVYEVIEAFGGVNKFYSDFYINSVCPLGFTKSKVNGKGINHNYYDSKELMTAVSDFIIESLKCQLKFGIKTDVCFCFGTGKNSEFLSGINAKEKFFKQIIPLEHPRFIMQYKAKSKGDYISKYLQAFAVK